MAVKPLNITHIIDHLGAGGAQRLVADLAIRQHRRGMSVKVVCLRQPTPLAAEIVRQQVEVVCLGLARWDPRQITSLTRLILAHQPDIVHTHLTMSGIIGRVAAALAGVPATVIHDHEAAAEIYITPGPLLALRRLAEQHLRHPNVWYVVISSSAERYAREVRRLPEGQIALVPNGVDIEHLYSGQCSPSEARARLGLPEGVPLLAYIGRLSYEKGVDVLLDAFREIAPAAHLVIAGRGPLEGELRRQVADLGLQDYVHLTGFLDDVRPALWASDICVQPSRREAFGLAAAEAAALGLPVVASAVGGLHDVVCDQVTGRLVPVGRPRELADALRQLLNNPAATRAMGAAGRQYISTRFHVETITDDIERVYERALGNYPHLA